LLLVAAAAPVAALGQAAGAPAATLADTPPPPPPPPPPAEPPPGPLRAPPKPTDWRLAVTFGAGSDGVSSYVIFGGTVGFQPLDRLELFLDGQYWSGSPSLGRVALGANWFPPVDFGPYLGGYFARWFVSGAQPDQNALGVHAGVSLARSRNAALLAGIAWEHTLACSTACDAWWPELSAGVRF
jgi:hypothetical protein